MNPFIAVHGLLGAVALLAGLIAAFAPKRAGLHVGSGRVFAGILLVSLLVISVPILQKGNVFMLGLGTVAWFATIEGWRALRRYRGTLQAAPDLVDHAAVTVTALVATGTAVYSVLGLVQHGNPLFAVCLVFAGLAAFLVVSAVRRRSQEVTPKQWLGVHVGNMSGALGAATTAALIVNLGDWFGSLQWILWVAPTVISTVWAQRVIAARNLT